MLKIHVLNLVLLSTACGQSPNTEAGQTVRVSKQLVQVGGRCECCEAIDEQKPKHLDWEMTISSADEPGEALEISGIIFHKDGKTPAAGVTLYVYHTDNTGVYRPVEGLSGCARRHGALRGWMLTDAEGKYRFRTIRPASYPGTKAVAHIHPIIAEPGKSPYYIDDFVFEDDPNLTANESKNLPERGGSGIITLTKEQGKWVGKRDIILGKNIPGYD